MLLRCTYRVLYFVYQNMFIFSDTSSHFSYIRNWGRLLLLVTFFYGLCVSTPVVEASDYFNYTCDRTFYVSKTGSDANPGTHGSPYLTINRGVETSGLTGGDCVEVGPGTYTEQIYWSANGTDDSDDGYIVVYSEVPHAAKIRPRSGDYSTVNMSGNYNILDGFDVVGGTGHAIDISGSHHIKVLNNITHDSEGSGISAQRGEFYTFEGNIAFNNACCNGFQTSGITIYQAREVASDTVTTGFRNIVRNNIAFNNFTTPYLGFDHTDGNGIIIDDFQHTQTGGFPVYPYPTLVENNLSYGNGGKGIQVTWSDYVTVRHNTTFGNNRDNNNSGTWRGEITNQQSSHNTFINNIAYANPAVNANNTALANVAYSSYVNSDIHWFNNLTFNGTPGQASVRVDGNATAITSAGGNILGADPKFESPALNAGGDFRLDVGSPAIGAGTSTLGYAALDLSGAARNSLALDLGAGPAAPDTGGPATPTVSFSLVAPVLIGLDWPESTDNIGISVYQIERCTGVGCSSYTLVATTTQTNYSSSVAPETTYRFRVRAQDVALNLSGYSSVIATTSLPMVVSTTSETIWGNETPDDTNIEDSDDYELGTIFSPLVDGTVTGVRFYVADDESGSHTARVWNNADDDVIGGPYTFSIGASGWYTYVLPAPITLEAGELYTVSITTGTDSGRAYVVSSGVLTTAGYNNSLLLYPRNAGVFTTTLGNRPTASYQSSNYYRDIEFLPATSSTATTTYTLSYTAGSNASLTGSSTQVVTEGADGSAITVVPNSGYQFVRWSDNSTSNPRTDTNVVTDLSVTAVIEAVSSSGGGGGGGGGGSKVKKKTATTVEATTTPLGVGSGDQTELLTLIALLKQLLSLYITLLNLQATIGQ